MQRTDLQDTKSEMHRLKVKLLREKGIEWRIQRTLEMMQWSADLFPEQTKAAILRQRKKA